VRALWSFHTPPSHPLHPTLPSHVPPTGAIHQISGLQTSEPWPQGPVKWTYLAHACPSDIVLGGCFPEACVEGGAPVSGSLKYYTISKCHKMVWSAGKPLATITDPEGNAYLMHATTTREAADAGVAAGDSALPEGWVRGTVTFDEDFVLTPAPSGSEEGTGEVDIGAREEFGDFACGYTLIQDSEGNAYHRYITTTGDSNIKKDLLLILNGQTFPEFRAQLQSTLFLGAMAGLFVLLVIVVLVCRFTKRMCFHPEVNKGLYSEHTGYKTLAKVGGILCFFVQIFDIFIHMRINDLTWAHIGANVSIIVSLFTIGITRNIAPMVASGKERSNIASGSFVHWGTSVGAGLYLIFIICFFALFGLTDSEGRSRAGIFFFIVASAATLAIINFGTAGHTKKMKTLGYVAASSGPTGAVVPNQEDGWGAEGPGSVAEVRVAEVRVSP